MVISVIIAALGEISDDAEKILCFEARAAYQETVDFPRACQLASVIGTHAAAVKDSRLLGSLCSKEFLEHPANSGVSPACLLRRRLSEWPTIAKWHPSSRNIFALISPVKAPCSSQ